MNWFKKLAGHGDTLDGQLLQQELTKTSREVRSLVSQAESGGPQSVLPRWRGEIRRRILLLPPMDRLNRLSMIELRRLQGVVIAIKKDMHKYDAGRLAEIVGK